MGTNRKSAHPADRSTGFSGDTGETPTPDTAPDSLHVSDNDTQPVRLPDPTNAKRPSVSADKPVDRCYK